MLLVASSVALRKNLQEANWKFVHLFCRGMLLLLCRLLYRLLGVRVDFCTIVYVPQ